MDVLNACLIYLKGQSFLKMDMDRDAREKESEGV